MPIINTTDALAGILVTSTGYALYGDMFWSPLLLFQHLQGDELHLSMPCGPGASSQAQTFLSVLNIFGVFITPMTGILCSDYWLICRQRLVGSDLFLTDGSCWYTATINWRAMSAFCLGFWPFMPGFIGAFTTPMRSGLDGEAGESSLERSSSVNIREKEAGVMV
ncbi:hypothetical protein GE09DRAFT_1223460 [Coniochaeta sp. 2T2.1]|nr:hypothetical protein GE09DRAFT_1223460 [Coniochaeta sp. 2T2.1]